MINLRMVKVLQANNKIRVSIGTAAVLGLRRIKLEAMPTTAYFMTYSNTKCTANCAFCTQARESSSNAELLSRVIWPVFDLNIVLQKLKKHISSEKILKRLCLQTINTPDLFTYLEHFFTRIQTLEINIPISVAIHAVERQVLVKLKEMGATDIGISIDAATKDIFDEIKGTKVGNSYSWDAYIDALRNAIDIFGVGHVATHLIVGLGETEKDAVEFIQKMYDMNVSVGLFAFTPIPGTQLENHTPPDIRTYRKIQLARYLIEKKISCLERFSFSENGEIIDFGIPLKELYNIIKLGTPFITSGCKNCNRPFYNEKPSSELYNYPYKPNSSIIRKILSELLGEEVKLNE